MPNAAPNHVIVVGAGMVGLSVTWFLQEYGVKVTVLDRKGVAGGSSWGNAGWLSPGLSIPLPEPSILKYGIKSLMHRDAPLYVPPALDLALAKFLVAFALRCTETAWLRAMKAYIPLNNQALDAYDAMGLGGDGSAVTSAPIMAAFQTRSQAKELLRELEMINAAGLPLSSQMLTGPELRESLTQLSSGVGFGVRIDGQRYIDPGAFTVSLGEAVVRRGATIIADKEVVSLSRDRDTVRVGTADGDRISGDSAVLATGAWMSKLGRPLGVKMPVRAGRGYSFSVPTTGTVAFPVYFPAVRVACTPMGDGKLRVAGTMEFAKPDAPANPGRIAAIVRSAKPLLDGVDWERKSEDWVGSRPVTADGMPLIGQSELDGVYIAGGHGMWGVTLGPVTGRLLASQIVKGEIPDQLRPFAPTR